MNARKTVDYNDDKTLTVSLHRNNLVKGTQLELIQV